MGVRILNFFDGFTSATTPTVGPSLSTYDIVISDGGEDYATHTTWASAMTSGSNGMRVLVLVSETVNSTFLLTFSNCKIEFAKDVTWTKGSATTGFSITGSNNKISDIRMSGFSTDGDKALVISGNKNRINDANFINCVNTYNVGCVQDTGANNNVTAPIEE